jgi:thiamine biosynthesis lipoprotein
MPHPTRRRFLKIVAAASASTLIPAIRGHTSAAAEGHSWSGEALGADASITLAGLDDEPARRLLEACRAEIQRLETIFSLYRQDSEISRLNARGSLADPARELVNLLDVCADLFRLSGGAFDPTIQPLWQLYAETYGHALSPGAPDAGEVARRRQLIGFDAVSWDARAVRFGRPGAAITLNGIAQGAITDRVTAILRAGGAVHALVNVGEYSAIGAHPAGRSWRVGIQDPRAPDGIAEVMELTDQAVATSGAYGGRFGESGYHHIVDPRTGTSPQRYLSVSVRHPSATLADGLSTAFSFMQEIEIASAAASIAGLSVLLVRPDGALVRL